VARDGTLTVLTWNVENLFSPRATSDGPDEQTYRKKIDYLARVIGGAAPDAAAVQEIGDPAAANDLAAALGNQWHVALSTHPDGRGIRVGVLAPHPVEIEAEVVDFPDGGLPRVPDVDGGVLTAMGRGAVQVRVGDVGVRVVTAHLKSKLLTYPHGRRYPSDEDERARGAGYALLRRAAEAVAVRVHLNAVMPAEPVPMRPAAPAVPTIVCGDLNDGPDAVTTTLLAGPDDADPRRPDKGDPVRLYNLASLLPPGRAYSRIYQGRGELIDHILVSRDLRLRVVTVDSLVDDIGSITASLADRRDAAIPDHAPVVARFAANG
jgi:endonuclease/exonuclease/phosphatase family metal-dependent hydrolase